MIKKSIMIPEDLFEEVKEICKKEGYKKTEFCQIAIKNELKRREKDEYKRFL